MGKILVRFKRISRFYAILSTISCTTQFILCFINFVSAPKNTSSEFWAFCDQNYLVSGLEWKKKNCNIATHCNTLPHTATLQHTATHFTMTPLPRVKHMRNRRSQCVHTKSGTVCVKMTSLPRVAHTGYKQNQCTQMRVDMYMRERHTYEENLDKTTECELIYYSPLISMHTNAHRYVYERETHTRANLCVSWRMTHSYVWHDIFNPRHDSF